MPRREALTRLTAKYVRSVLVYDSDTGIFTWRVRVAMRARAGDIAGHRMRSGYVQIMIDKVHYQAHRLAWLYVTGMWPSGDLDHKDLNKSNNAISNLREATDTQNKGNRRALKNNKLGVKGVLYDAKMRRPYRAQIWINGRSVYLGGFATAEEASAAYAAAAVEHFGEFSRKS